MVTAKSFVEEIIKIENNIHLLKIYSPQIASEITPGQFLNIKVSDNFFPLLRRPFSICDVDEKFIYIMFNILGDGTKILARKRTGEELDILGPLGHGFKTEGNFDTAIIVAGGLGAAPFPLFTKQMSSLGKNIYSFIGGKSESDIITYGMNNTFISTDDGSFGFKGTVIELLNRNIKILQENKIKIFSCGPTPMLRALKEFCVKNNFDCEVSTESAMACGFGICQGCPIESESKKDKYLLVCKDGPVFNIKDVLI